MGQPQDGGDPSLSGPGTDAASALCGSGQPLRPESEVLSAGQGHEKPRVEIASMTCNGVGRRPCLAPLTSPNSTPTCCVAAFPRRTHQRREHRDGGPTLRARAARGAAESESPFRRLRLAARSGRQVPDGRFDGNAYSVPRRWAFRPVTVKGYVDRVVLTAEGQAVAQHVRCYGKGQRLLDPLHFLASLENGPRPWITLQSIAIGNSPPPSPPFAASWKSVAAGRRVRGTSPASCNCSADIP